MSLYEVISRGQAPREPPMLPSAFAARVEGGVLSFSRQSDAPLVTAQYTKAFATQLETAVVLPYGELGWDDAAGVAVCEALRFSHRRGGLKKLQALFLNGNAMGDETVTALAALLEEHEGALAAVERVYLSDNAITDRGMKVLAAVLARGALPSLRQIFLRGNPGREEAVQAALSRRKE